MTDTDSPAVRTVLAYFQAWTGHDLDKAMSYIADAIVCDTPGGRIQGAEAFRGFMAPFTQILTGAELLAAYGDAEHAVIVYDTATVPVASAPAAEYITVTDGKISYDRFIFDRLPFEPASKSLPGTRGQHVSWR